MQTQAQRNENFSISCVCACVCVFVVHTSICLCLRLHLHLHLRRSCEPALNNGEKCEAFILKVCDFKQQCQNMQTKLDLEQYCPVKRCMELSLSCEQPAKCSAGKSRGEASAKQLLFGETSTEISKSDQQEFLEKADPSSIVKDVEELSTPLRGSQHQDDDGNNLVAVITGALNSQPADAMAEIIRTHCPNVFLALQSAIAAEVRTACQKLCRRSQGSVLYGNRYESVKEFTFDSIWNEMERNIPFMIQIMSAVSAKNSANISVDLLLSQFTTIHLA